MTFAVAAEYGIAICVATVALMQLSSVARPRWSFDRALVACQRHSRTVQAGLFGRKDIR
jgi:hypothetical protein